MKLSKKSSELFLFYSEIAIFIIFTLAILYPDNTILNIVLSMAIFFMAIEYAYLYIKSQKKISFILKPINILNAFIIITFILFQNDFIILAIFRLFKGDFLVDYLRSIAQYFPFINKRLGFLLRIIHLIVFLFIITLISYNFREIITPGQINSYVDAFYFAASAITTTGFGDIVSTTQIGKMFSILIMFIGIILFFRIVEYLNRKEFTEKIEDVIEGKFDDQAEPIKCPHCGNKI